MFFQIPCLSIKRKSVYDWKVHTKKMKFIPNFFQKLKKKTIETLFSFKQNVQDVIVYTWWIIFDIHDKIDYHTFSIKTSFSIRAEFYQTGQVLIRCTQIPRVSSTIFSFWCFLKLSCVHWTFVHRGHGKSVRRNL